MTACRHLDALRRRATAPVSAASLGALRVLYGATLFVAVLRFVARGWVDALYVAPVHLFAHWGFSWLPRPSRIGFYALFATLAAAALAITVGMKTRVAWVVFTVGFTWIELLDRSTYLNHYYFISIFSALLALLPTEARFSLDARRRPDASPIAAWMLWVPRAQIAIVYWFAGIAKLKTDWLFHAEPLYTWLSARSEVPYVGPLLATKSVAYAMSWGGALFDLTVPFALMARRTRSWAYLAVIVFHGVTGALFNIGMFPWVMVCVTTVFFDPAWPERFAARRVACTVAHGSHSLRLPRPFVAVVLAAHFSLQTLLPLRMHLYVGDPCWTEQGFRFAWHVMVMEKAGDVRFHVIDRHRNRRWQVEPDEFLTPTQARVMAATPDMILSAAHMLRDDFARRGVRDVEVRVDAWASLHGRPARRLIDPTVDLARERDSLRPYTWVYPDPTHAPLR